MTTISKFQIINGDVTIDFNRFCDNAAICEENEIDKDFDNRSYQINDSEAALNEISSFIRESLAQLKNGHKVIFTRTNGNPPIVFNDLDSFRAWANEFFSIPRYRFIKSRAVDTELNDELK